MTNAHENKPAPQAESGLVNQPQTSGSGQNAIKAAEDSGSEQPERPDHTGFDSMIENYLGQLKNHPTGAVVNARVISIKEDTVFLDIGEKAEGVVSTAEFADAQGNINVAPGAEFPVIIQQRDEDSGQVAVSYLQARERVNWKNIQTAFAKGAPVKGKIVKAVNKGVLVDVGAEAFMPASQIDLKPVGELESVVGREVEVRILELNRKTRRLVVSARVLLEERRGAVELEFFEKLQVGEERRVTIKRIVEFGAFADLGGIDGLIPRSEISWDRNADPAQHLTVGEELNVKVIGVDPEKKKITLSRKQLQTDPWEQAAEKYPAGSVVTGKIAHTTHFEAFVTLEEGISGRIHHSELSWAKGRAKISDHFTTGDTVRCIVLSVDGEKRRLALGLKQLDVNPWDEIRQELKVGSKITGKVTSLTKFGAFVQLNQFIEGLIHNGDLSWDKNITQPDQILKVGDEVETLVLSIDAEKERIGLGLKQLESSPFELFIRRNKKGAAVEGKVVQLMDFRAIVELTPGVEGSIHVSQLSEERVEKPSDELKVGETVRALIVKIEPKKQRIELSRRDLLKSEEKAQIAEFLNKNQGSVQSFKELFANVKLENGTDKES